MLKLRNEAIERVIAKADADAWQSAVFCQAMINRTWKREDVGPPRVEPNIKFFRRMYGLRNGDLS